MSKLTCLGTFWKKSGDLFTMTHKNGNDEARVYVDSLGETWVDIRRVPAGGYFHTERVEAFHVPKGSQDAERRLRADGFENKRIALYADRVEERDI